MRGFIKFISILVFGFFCFAGGVAKESGHKEVAIYCILGGTMILLNGFSAVTEMDIQELGEKNRKETEGVIRRITNENKNC